MNALAAWSAGIALAGAVIFLAAVIAIVVAGQRRAYNAEVAPIKGSPGRGVLWAFTQGMAPWSKESGRIHWKAYIRGVVFHIGIFAGAAYLIATPWLPQMSDPWRFSLSALFAVCAIVGLAGFWIRRADSTLRLLTTPDDYFSLALVTLFLASAAASAYTVTYLPVFWIMSGITLAYTPFGKLRHFIYFFYVRAFVGSAFGRRHALEQ